LPDPPAVVGSFASQLHFAKAFKTGGIMTRQSEAENCPEQGMGSICPIFQAENENFDEKCSNGPGLAQTKRLDRCDPIEPL
jgi:hypothetical protein